jgi:hypothetical protein
MDLSPYLPALGGRASLTWQVITKDATGNETTSRKVPFTVLIPKATASRDFANLASDSVGQRILSESTNGENTLTYMATNTSKTVVSPVISGDVPIKFRVDDKTGTPLIPTSLRIFDRNGRLVLQKQNLSGTLPPGINATHKTNSWHQGVTSLK